MSVVTVRLPEDQHQRLKAMAQARGISLNKLFEQLTAQALTENDIELRYRRLAGGNGFAYTRAGAVGQAGSPRARALNPM